MKTRDIVLFAPLFITLLVSLNPVNSQAQGPTTLTFGVVPQQAASKLARLWTPILAYLGEQTGYQFRFKTARDIPTFEKRLAEGEYDMAYMNPYHYTVFHRQPGYVAFAMEKDKKIRGIIVVRKDSQYKDLTEFKDQVLAFPSPAAFAASVLTRAQFAKIGIPIKPKYVSSHDSVYRTVAKGLYPAGGGVMRTLKIVDPAISKQLRVLWTTRFYTPHAIAAHQRIPASVVEQTRRAMGEMDQNPRGRELLEAVKFKGIVPARDADWDDVRALGIHLLDRLVKSHRK
ncbi:MAG TPA: phosphate/phosphite/phosphonate ABC transporter substrate-binding protein [Acidiferrobacteraceae bacterium]|nr:phosphate/phosphite/phosphonate ABC transporter substrate-binding protein [Acidiferrobacteraceae bacterium]